jgi:hypothetical protein
MRNDNLTLPSNKKFGLFFSLIFFLIFLYFNFNYIFLFLSIIFLIIALFFSKSLFLLNKFWMKLGEVLGVIISPIVLGAIFFILISPLAMLLRILNRDILKLKLNSHVKTYWITREKNFTKEDFDNQF